MNRRSFIRKSGLFVPATFGILIPGKALADDFYFNFRRRTAGGALGFTFVQGNSAATDAGGNGALPTVQLTNVAAGNLIVYWAKNEAAQSLTAVSDGTNSLTMSAENNHTTDGIRGRMAYLLSSSAGTKTYTPTFNAVNDFKQVYVAEFSYAGTLALGAENHTADGSGTAPASVAITTTAANALVCAGMGHFNGGTYSSKQIGGVAAGGSFATDQSSSTAFYRILTATMTTGTGAATMSASDSWVASIISFNVT